MNHLNAAFVVGAALASFALPACERDPRELTAGELAAIKAEVKAELKQELEAELKPAGRPGSADAVTLSPAERLAIAEARTQARAAAPADTPSTPGVAPRVATPAAPAAPAKPVPAAAAAGDTEPDDPELPLPEAAQEQPADASDRETGPAREVRPGMLVYATGGDLQLVDLAIGTAVTDREPQDVHAVYERMPELFFCYTVFANRGEEQMVTHVWRHGGRLVSRVELEVSKSPGWRTWSRQRTRQDWTGPWSCEVLGPDGRRIGIASIEIKG